MSISSLIGVMPSLVDYMQGGSKSSDTGISGFGGSSSSSDLSSMLSGGDTLNLSPAAQKIMAQNTSTPETAATTKDKAAAQEFFLNFFDDSGVDPNGISDEAAALLQGIAEAISELGAVTRDTGTDKLTNSASKGTRQSLSLQGDGQRMSFTVQYKDGKPESLTMLQIQGSSATSATINLTKDTAGKANGITVNSVQKEYTRFGGMTSSVNAETLNIDLYAKT